MVIDLPVLKKFFAAALRVDNHARYLDQFARMTNKYLTMKTFRQHLRETIEPTSTTIDPDEPSDDTSDDFDVDAYLAAKYPDAVQPADSATAQFDRLGKSSQEPEFDFRKGIVEPEAPEWEPDVKIGRAVEPDAADTDAFTSAVDSYGEQNPYMQAWGGKYASGGQPQWRYVEKGEDPARYGTDSAVPAASKATDLDWGRIAPALDLDSKKAQPQLRFNRFTHQVEPIDSPPTDSTLDDADKPQEMSWRDIYRLNKKTIGLDPRLIRPGQLLKMPNGQPDYTVQKGDTLVKIASQSPDITPPRPRFPHTPTRVSEPKEPRVPRFPHSKTPAEAPLPPFVADPNSGNIQPKVTANTGLNFPLPSGLSLKKGEELVTPALEKARKQADHDIAAYEKKQRDRADRQQAAKRSVKEHSPEFMKQLRDFIVESEAPSDIKPRGMNRTMGSAISTHRAQEKNGKYTDRFDSTAMFHDPANPNDNSYMDRSSTTTDGEEENSTRYATNVTPKWMAHLKAQAGLPVDPADEPPSQYPTQVGQGMNNKPFAAYSTAPGTMTVNRATREGIGRAKHLRDYILEAEAPLAPQGAKPFTPNQTMDPQQAAAANKAAQDFVAQLTAKVKTLAQTHANVLKTVTAKPVSTPQPAPVQEAQLNEGLFDGIVSWVKDALAKNPLIDIALRLIPSPAQAILAAIDVIDAVKSGNLADAAKSLAGMIPGGQQVAQAIGVGQAAASGDATSVATGLASAALPKVTESELDRIITLAKHSR